MSKRIHFSIDDMNHHDASLLVRCFDRNLAFFEESFGVTLTFRNSDLLVEGSTEAVDTVVSFLNGLDTLFTAGVSLSDEDFRAAVPVFLEEHTRGLHDIFAQRIEMNFRGKTVVPKSINQKRYVKAMDTYDLVFSIGPAGTGKTYLAVAKAVAALKEGEVERVILTRPAVEAGEHLGFLPGDLIEKVNPYLRPLDDALFDILGKESVQRLKDSGRIEIAPLAYMRGRTLHNAFIIMDEAQNTSTQQMKMFLTRMGVGSKAVVTGDITQIDLPQGKASGLVIAQKVLSQVSNIKFIHFTGQDVVRHKLVRDIIAAYNRYEQGKSRKKNK